MNAYGSLAPVYDAFTRDVDYGAFADFYEAAFARRKRPVRTVLDLGCGTGTLTALLARRGYELLAADASPDMLMVAQEKFAALPDVTPPLFLCQSMTELDLYGTVDAAVSCLDAVNYLPPKDLPELLRRLHLFLEPDGVFVFDIQSPRVCARSTAAPRWTRTKTASVSGAPTSTSRKTPCATAWIFSPAGAVSGSVPARSTSNMSTTRRHSGSGSRRPVL